MSISTTALSISSILDTFLSSIATPHMLAAGVPSLSLPTVPTVAGPSSPAIFPPLASITSAVGIPPAGGTSIQPTKSRPVTTPTPTAAGGEGGAATGGQRGGGTVVGGSVPGGTKPGGPPVRPPKSKPPIPKPTPQMFRKRLIKLFIRFIVGVSVVIIVALPCRRLRQRLERKQLSGDAQYRGAGTV